MGLEISVANELLATPLVTTDPGWLLLILLNFLSNAFKHTRHGTVSVMVTIAGSMLRFEVCVHSILLTAALPHAYGAPPPPCAGG